MADLPSIIPLFPLPNLVLFPGVRVPLHIFESRYREMIEDVSRGDRLIGMMLLKGDWERDYYANPDVFAFGCGGRIAEMVKLPDGRFNIVLEGISEFRIVREIRDRSYRRSEVQWCPTPATSLECDVETIEGIREVLYSYLGAPAHDAWRTLVEERGLRDRDLINFLCFHLDLSPIEKQTLLEAREGRIDCLLDILSFRLEERKVSGGGRAGGGSETIQ
ncbi:MAG TPA: LON peptidase substrate-binding domain-containing protein [Candidatus Binatus sp.]|nr:LON peptidase substrate-binding domain-containing protein [Candidatus Binatus sp.]